MASSGTQAEKVVVWTIKHPFPTAIGKLVVTTLDAPGYRASLKFIASVGPFFAAIYDPRNRAQIGFVGWGSDYPAASQFRSMFTCQDAASANVSATQLCNHATRPCDLERPQRAEHRLTEHEPELGGGSTGGSWSSRHGSARELTRSVVVGSRRVGNVQFNPEWGTLIDQLWVR